MTHRSSALAAVAVLWSLAASAAQAQQTPAAP